VRAAAPATLASSSCLALSEDLGLWNMLPPAAPEPPPAPVRREEAARGDTMEKAPGAAEPASALPLPRVLLLLLLLLLLASPSGLGLVATLLTLPASARGGQQGEEGEGAAEVRGGHQQSEKGPGSGTERAHHQRQGLTKEGLLVVLLSQGVHQVLRNGSLLLGRVCAGRLGAEPVAHAPLALIILVVAALAAAAHKADAGGAAQAQHACHADEDDGHVCWDCARAEREEGREGGREPMHG
jgi:hypothetical protein